MLVLRWPPRPRKFSRASFFRQTREEIHRRGFRSAINFALSHLDPSPTPPSSLVPFLIFTRLREVRTYYDASFRRGAPVIVIILSGRWYSLSLSLDAFKRSMDPTSAILLLKCLFALWISTLVKLFKKYDIYSSRTPRGIISTRDKTITVIYHHHTYVRANARL